MNPTTLMPALLVSLKPANAVIRPISAATPVITSAARATVRAFGVRSPASFTSQTDPTSESRSSTAPKDGGVRMPCTPPAAASEAGAADEQPDQRGQDDQAGECEQDVRDRLSELLGCVGDHEGSSDVGGRTTELCGWFGPTAA